MINNTTVKASKPSGNEVNRRGIGHRTQGFLVGLLVAGIPSLSLLWRDSSSRYIEMPRGQVANVNGVTIYTNSDKDSAEMALEVAPGASLSFTNDGKGSVFVVGPRITYSVGTPPDGEKDRVNPKTEDSPSPLAPD